MNRRLTLICVLVFVLGTLAGASISTGCGGDDMSPACPCPATPATPDPQTVPLTRLTTHDPNNSAAFLLETPPGTIALTDTTVVIAYTQLGVDHRITYQVVGPRAPAE